MWKLPSVHGSSSFEVSFALRVWPAESRRDRAAEIAARAAELPLARVWAVGGTRSCRSRQQFGQTLSFWPELFLPRRRCLPRASPGQGVGCLDWIASSQSAYDASVQAPAGAGARLESGLYGGVATCTRGGRGYSHGSIDLRRRGPSPLATSSSSATAPRRRRKTRGGGVPHTDRRRRVRCDPTPAHHVTPPTPTRRAFARSPRPSPSTTAPSFRQSWLAPLRSSSPSARPARRSTRRFPRPPRRSCARRPAPPRSPRPRRRRSSPRWRRRRSASPTRLWASSSASCPWRSSRAAGAERPRGPRLPTPLPPSQAVVVGGGAFSLFGGAIERATLLKRNLNIEYSPQKRFAPKDYL